MLGMEEFINIFGDFSILHLLELVLALYFLYVTYNKVSIVITTKYKKKQEQEEMLKRAIEHIEQYPEYRKQSKDIQEKLQKQINILEGKQSELCDFLTKMKEDLNRRDRNKIRDRLLQSYRYYTDVAKNPMQAITEMESEAFWSLFADYEGLNGDGFMHSVVQPAMNLLTVVSMDDIEGLTSLMASRK